MVFDNIRMHRRRITRMIKRKLQDLTACCAYNVNFLHAKEHGWREFRRQYEVHDEIGRGGFGVVYGGMKVADGRGVAIKFIEHRHVREWTLAGSHLIPSEVSHLEMCSDIPGVIGLLDWFANSKGFVLIMERPTDCIDVFDLVSRYGRLDEATARFVFLQVVETVCAMYAKHGLIHRDIKDENIIINMETGEVKLVDFGATTQCDKAFKKEFQGTRSYCPPEWFRLLQYLPLEATSWSLGVLLFILVTGQLPFKNEIQICLGSIKFPPYLTKEVCSLIKRCLTTAPSTRASLLEIRGHAWLSHPPTEFRRPFQSELDRTLKPRRRHSAARDDSGGGADDVMMISSERRFATATPVGGQHAQREQSGGGGGRSVDSAHPSTRQSSCAGFGASAAAGARRSSRLSDSRSTALTRESTEYLEAVETLPVKLDQSSVSLSRLASRYDNISASSLGDYYSVASFDPSHVGSLPSNAFEQSFTSDEEPSEEMTDSIRGLNIRSLSAYSLSRRRRSLLPRSSFERELDTVEETDISEHSPLITSGSAQHNSPPASLSLSSSGAGGGMPSSRAMPYSASCRVLAAYTRSVSPSPEPAPKPPPRQQHKPSAPPSLAYRPDEATMLDLSMLDAVVEDVQRRSETTRAQRGGASATLAQRGGASATRGVACHAEPVAPSLKIFQAATTAERSHR